MPQLLVKLCKSHREMALYLFFGVATTAVNWCVYGSLVRLWGCPVAPGNAAAWVVAVSFAFVTNKLWVFGSHGWGSKLILREAGTFLGARAASGVVEIAGVPLLVRAGLSYPLFGVQGFAAKVTVGVVVIALNYIFSKRLVFRRER